MSPIVVITVHVDHITFEDIVIMIALTDVLRMRCHDSKWTEKKTTANIGMLPKQHTFCIDSQQVCCYYVRVSRNTYVVIVSE